MCLGCGGASASPPPGHAVTSTPSALPSPTTRPAAAADAPFKPPEIIERRLDNGIRLLMVERRELPLLRLEAVILRGAADAPSSVASFAADMLSERARESGAPIAEVRAGLDAVTFGGWGVTRWWSSSNLSSQAFDAMAKLLLQPELGEEAFYSERQRRLSRANDDLDPWVLLARYRRTSLYPREHPYREGAQGELGDAATTTPEAVQRFAAQSFFPDDLVLIAVGDIARESFVDSVRLAFGRFRGHAPPRAPLGEILGPPPGATLTVIDEPGFPRAHVRVAARAVRQGSPDAEPLEVLNAVLGSTVVSRLSVNLREEKAWSYGSYSSIAAGRSNGLFEAWATVERADTVAALGEISSEIQRLRDELLGAEELARVKRAIVRRLPMRFATLASTVDALERLAIYELPADEYTKSAQKLEAVTSADVRRVARAYLAPDALRWFVLTDSPSVRDALLASPFRDFAEVSPRVPVQLVK
ncbi:MAG TPA: pitrilysin family protein [Polyangiaceae bacterium]|nr:pitrilysin family protein [Polyangiaceae bacterium]